MTDVLIAFPTYRRPAWAVELVDAIAAEADATSGIDWTLLVADNSPDAEGAAVQDTETYREGRLRYLHAPQGGLATVRNAILDQAVAGTWDVLVCIDDDEIPEPGWISELLACRETYDADVVGGVCVVESAADAPLAERLARMRPARPVGPTDEDILHGNVLIDLGFARRAGIRYSPTLDSSGGEDTLFFRQARQAGARTVWCPTSRIVERRDPARFTIRGVVRRSWNSGRSSHHIDIAQGEARPRWHRGAVLVLSLCRTIVLAAAYLVTGRTEDAMRHVLKTARHAGRLAADSGPGDHYAKGAPA